jgi:subtilisin family serine protease
MKHTVLALACASAALVGCASDPLDPAARPSPAAAPTLAPAADDSIPGQYVVVLRGAVRSAADVQAAASGKLAGGRGLLRRTYSRVLPGFAAQLTPAGVAALRGDPDVLLVEPDRVIRATGCRPGRRGGSTGSTSRRSRSTAATRTPTTGRASRCTSSTADPHRPPGVRRARGAGRDFVTAGGTSADCHGHGTHVAGTVGGATYGVAKGARLVAVRVLDCAGNGTGSGLIGALDWVAQQKAADANTPAVVNMSLTGDASSAIDQAVRATVAAGVTVAAAAATPGATPAGVSPARTAEAITVGASDNSDWFAGFSNRGGCVDLTAPGVGIESAGIGGPTATAWMSGTSMAAPHVAGAAALYLAAHRSAGPAQVAAALEGGAVSGAVQHLPAGTSGRLLNVAFLAAPPAPPADGPRLLQSAAAPGLCLAVASGHANAVDRTLLAPCAAVPAQQWTVTVAPGVGEVRAFGGAQCLDAWGGWMRVGDVVGTWQCVGVAWEQWTLTAAGELRLSNGLCAAVNGPAVAGAGIVLQSCSGGAGQRWTAPGSAPAATRPAGPPGRPLRRAAREHAVGAVHRRVGRLADAGRGRRALELPRRGQPALVAAVRRERGRGARLRAALPRRVRRCQPAGRRARHLDVPRRGQPAVAHDRGRRAARGDGAVRGPEPRGTAGRRAARAPALLGRAGAAVDRGPGRDGGRRERAAERRVARGA